MENGSLTGRDRGRAMQLSSFRKTNNENAMTTRKLLVTGAAGNLGRQVLDALLEAKAGPIVATTRTPEKLADYAKRGIEVRRVDFNDPASLKSAFAGAERLLLEVRADNTAARGLYDSAGFRLLQTRRGYYPGGVDALVLVLDLSQEAQA